MGTGQTASMEDYLEAIAMLGRDQQVIRVSHISKALGVRMPSVTFALKRLAEDGLVLHERYGHVELTEQGEHLASDVFRRHEALRRFLTEILDVTAEVAREDACKMEHSLSPPTGDRLSEFVEFILSDPRGQPQWVGDFKEYVQRCEVSNG